MRTRRLGRTELQISELVLGGGYVGGLLLHADIATRREALRRVFEAGVNWIDTAPAYGEGRSEEAIGALLPEFEVQPWLSTKVRLDSDGGDPATQIRRSLAASLERLGQPAVTLLQLHNRLGAPAALPLETLLGPGGVADTFDALKNEGLIRFAGITALGDPASCRQAVESGRFDTAQVYLNLLNPSAGLPASTPGWSSDDFGGLLRACQAQDVGVLAIRILAAGVLASDERHGREIPITRNADMESEGRRMAAVLPILRELPDSRAQAAIRFVLGEPRVAGAVLGVAELSHVDEGLAAVARGPLPDDVRARLRDAIIGFEASEGEGDSV